MSENSKPSSPDITLVSAADAQTSTSEATLASLPTEILPEDTNHLTLSTIEQWACENSPAIRQANAAVAKAMGFRDQVGRYPNPVGGINSSQLADRGTDQHVAFLEQDIVRGKKLERNRHVLEQEVQAQLWQVEMTRQRVLTDVRVRFYETLAAQQRVALAASFEKVTARGVEVAQRRLDALEGNRPELLQTRIQQSEVQLLQQRAEITFDAAWRALFNVVGVPCNRGGSLAGSLSLPLDTRDWEAEYCQLETVSPEIRMAYSRVAAAQANLQRQQVQPIPNLSLMIAGGYDNGTNSQMINTQLGMPLPLYNKNQGNIAAAWGEYCRTTQELARLKLAIRGRLIEAGRNYDIAAAQVRRYQDEILPNAEEALTLSEQAFRAGELEFLQVLIVRRTFFDASLELVQARSDFAQSRSLVDGQLLSGSLTESTDTVADDSLRGQTLSGQ
jgi:cobalt-zinc-cadmium efflux system outer membrane protein